MRARPGWTLFVLFLLNTFNFFDRNVLGAVVEPLRRDWRLTDAEVGWLGTAFTLLYAVVGLPMGRLADSGRRTTLLAGGALLWSAMTALSALTSTFRGLFAARLAVGVGEAVCAPAATSLIADLYPSARRGRATAVFMLGLPVGVGLSYAIGGAVAQAWGWRAAFLVAGLPGLAVALLCLLLPEPVRGAAEAHPVGAARRPGSALGVLVRTPTLSWIVLSGALHNFNMYALAIFVPAYLSRHHGLTVADAGALSGLMFGVFGGLGMVLGGWVGDRVAMSREGGRLLTSAVALATSVPLLLLFLGQPRGAVGPALVFVCPALLLMYLYYAPVYATIQDIVEPSRRGTAMAVYFFAMYLLGASLGPVGTGVLSDRLAARAAAAAGAPAVTEAFRAVGLHQAMYIVPLLTVGLALVLLAGARAAVRDRRLLTTWMEAARASQEPVAGG
ncbi:MAG TPA: MFS transporter [Vicinamibacteria bacterium]|nr:MFS transporter [Vicinamibacteria bacterium]